MTLCDHHYDIVPNLDHRYGAVPLMAQVKSE